MSASHLRRFRVMRELRSPDSSRGSEVSVGPAVGGLTGPHGLGPCSPLLTRQGAQGPGVFSERRNCRHSRCSSFTRGSGSHAGPRTPPVYANVPGGTHIQGQPHRQASVLLSWSDASVKCHLLSLCDHREVAAVSISSSVKWAVHRTSFLGLW